MSPRRGGRSGESGLVAELDQQGFEGIPIVGATRLEQLNENLNMIDLVLTPEDLKQLDTASAIDLGFPGKFFREDGVRQNNYGGFYDKIIPRT